MHTGIEAECWYCMKPGFLYRHSDGYNIAMCDTCRGSTWGDGLENMAGYLADKTQKEIEKLRKANEDLSLRLSLAKSIIQIGIILDKESQKEVDSLREKLAAFEARKNNEKAIAEMLWDPPSTNTP